MKTIERSFTVTNPGAVIQNRTAQRQLAAWIVEWGIAQGTIKLNKGVRNERKEAKVLRMRRRPDEKELCAGLG